jgi:hypothetical protein
MYKFLKTLHPGGIRTRDLLFVGGRDDHYLCYTTIYLDFLLESTCCEIKGVPVFSGANPAISEITPIMPAFYVMGWSVFFK